MADTEGTEEAAVCSPVLVRARGLRQGYRRHEVVHGVDLAVQRGVVGLLGPNGAGKTTLLRTLTTGVAPRSGELELLGLDPTHRADVERIRRRIGFLPQSVGFFPGFTVHEFVTYAAWLRKVPAAQIKDRVEVAVEAVGLGSATRTKMRKLSGGMLRRAGIAQAIVNDPDLLILDEPTAGLDPEQRVDFRVLLREFGEHNAVIIATHLVEDVARACSAVLVMAGGHIAFRGTPEDLAACGDDTMAGDTPLERGYAATLRRQRQEPAS